jgi:L-lactate utilization protein LutB
MTKLGIVKKATKNGIQVFFIKDISDLSRFVDKQVENLNYIEKNKMRILDEIQKTKLESANLPKISIYDNSE